MAVVWVLGPLVAALPVLSVPAVAQPATAPQATDSSPDDGAPQGDGESALTALIPDSAVAHPEDWAAKLAVPPATTPAQTPPQPLPADTGGQTGPTVAGQPPLASPAPASPSADALAVQSALNPDSPLDELPGFSLPWPDLAQAPPELAGLAPDAPSSAPAPSLTTFPALPEPVTGAPSSHAADRVDHFAAGRVVLAWHTEGGSIPERTELETRFRALSTLQAMTTKEAENLPQFAQRAASDRAMIEQLLHVYGYYDAEATETLGAPISLSTSQPAGAVSAKSAAQVRFDIVPGQRYRFGLIDLGQLATTGPDFPVLRKSFAIVPGDPLHLDAIPTQTQHLEAALGESGYVFAHIDPPALTVDHLREEGDLALPVKPGGQYRFGEIVSTNPRFLSGHHLARIARFHAGQTYKLSEVEDLRRAILATGLVSSLTVTPREEAPPSPATATTPATPGVVALDVGMTPAPAKTISGAIGYDTAQGFRLEGGWEHRNLFPPEGSLHLRGVAGTNEQLAGVTFRRANFNGRDRVLTFDVTADNATLPAYAARAVDFTATYERQTTVLFQKPWSWSLGLEAEASAEREGVPSGITTGRVNYLTFAAPLRASWDRSNDLLDPRHGYRVSLRLSPEVSQARGITSTYARTQLDASWYQPAFAGVVLATRLRLGSIFGTDLENIAPSRRLYAGGGGSIRGFGYELVGPRNALNEPLGARSLYEVSLEARVNTGLFHNSLALVPFLDTGGAGTGTVPNFQEMRYGAGLGFRYETGFGPVRLDIGTPLDPHPGDSRVGVYITLGQAF